jgi:hypothetical protein
MEWSKTHPTKQLMTNKTFWFFSKSDHCLFDFDYYSWFTRGVVTFKLHHKKILHYKVTVLKCVEIVWSYSTNKLVIKKKKPDKFVFQNPQLDKNYFFEMRCSTLVLILFHFKWSTQVKQNCFWRKISLWNFLIWRNMQQVFKSN